MKEKKVAIIDMGSNSIRLVINKIDNDGRYTQLHNFKVVARLSSHMTQKGHISKEGISIIISSLLQFKNIISYHKVDQVNGVATAAVRRAANQEEVLHTIKKETGFSFRVLSEYEEAYYGYLAVVNSTNIENGITIDIGGGSTEVTIFKNRKMIHYTSFPFGAITLKQQFMNDSEPLQENLDALTSFLTEQYESLDWIVQSQLPVIGIGGTARNLSLVHQRQVDYPLAGLHQYELTKQDVESTQALFTSVNIEERQNIDGLSKDRSDIIIPAVQAILTLLNVTGSKTFTMSNRGLRDGLFYEEILTQLGLEHFPNVAEESFYQITHMYEINLDHVKQVWKLAKSLYRQLVPYVNETSSEQENDLSLLKYSARMLYMGEFISNEASSQHTFYLITNMSIDGLTHQERLAIALISSFKSKSYLQKFAGPFESLLTKQQLKQYEFLGAILKLAYALNRTRRNIVTSISVMKETEDHFMIYFHCNDDYPFEEQLANKYKKHIEKLINAKISLHFLS
ncbi:Ppx/GppA phosphatase family protein [Alkalihalobacterium bogoriense]|uniref:Ppx/GppA phosphatase family protein n=1 Tax=Alkalihalobacterium bogoriense TaxID=246272 RepID=UPI00047897B8|nr:Ppx/GppA phosphatase family protein [Alkalihalobacterium bogoriense]